MERIPTARARRGAFPVSEAAVYKEEKTSTSHPRRRCTKGLLEVHRDLGVHALATRNRRVPSPTAAKPGPKKLIEIALLAFAEEEPRHGCASMTGDAALTARAWDRYSSHETPQVFLRTAGFESTLKHRLRWPASDADANERALRRLPAFNSIAACTSNAKSGFKPQARVELSAPPAAPLPAPRP